MNAMKRFVLFLKGRRAPVQDDDDNTYRPWWWGADEDPSLNFIRREAALRKHDDLMAALDTKPPKKLTIITTADVGNKTPKGQK